MLFTSDIARILAELKQVSSYSIVIGVFLYAFYMLMSLHWSRRRPLKVRYRSENLLAQRYRIKASTYRQYYCWRSVQIRRKALQLIASAVVC